MRTVLCFGDSNTYGYIPGNGKRYASDIRWTGILKNKFKNKDVEIVEEGLVGRTTVFEDSVRPGRKGSDFLIPLLETHSEVDELVLMLGTNDCKSLYKASAHVIGMGVETLVKQAKSYNPNLKILLISPIHLGDEVWKDDFDPEFDENSVLVSKKLAGEYLSIARQYNCDYLNAADVAEPSEADQEHLTVDGHRKLAEAIEKLIL